MMGIPLFSVRLLTHAAMEIPCQGVVLPPLPATDKVGWHVASNVASGGE